MNILTMLDYLLIESSVWWAMNVDGVLVLENIHKQTSPSDEKDDDLNDDIGYDDDYYF